MDGLATEIRAVHGGRDPDAPGRLLEPFVVARRDIRNRRRDAWMVSNPCLRRQVQQQGFPFRE